MKKCFTSIDQLPLTLDAGEIARTLGISRANAYNLLHAEGFPTLRIGKRLIVPKDQLIAWMKANTGGAA